MSLSDLLNANLIDEPPGCKGKIYRGRKAVFNTANGFGLSLRLVLLKRMSCPGCRKCGGLNEVDVSEHTLYGLNEVREGRLYRLHFFGTGGDYYDGCESYEVRLTEVKT